METLAIISVPEYRQIGILELRKLIDKAEASGFSTRSIDDIWNDKLKELGK